MKQLIQNALRATGYYLRSTRHFGDSYWQDLVTLQAVKSGPAKLLFDVGAHHGQTLSAMRQYFPGAAVHCFEPDPESFAQLEKAAAGLAQVQLHPLALGAAPSKATFHRNKESMTNSLLPTSKESLQGHLAELTSTQDVIEVPVDMLDTLCQREHIGYIDILKTDCQGYDLMVLQGGRQMIAAHKIGLITCEVIFDSEYDGQGKYHELFKFLDDHDYRLTGLYNMARDARHECTFCDAIFVPHPKA